MRLRNIPGARETIAESEHVIKEEAAEGVQVNDHLHLKASSDGERPVAESGRRVLGDWKVKGHWAEVFGNDHPVQIEIGMGKGTFLMRMAKRYPGINFVGIEKYSSVLLRAIQKMDAEPLPNVKLIRMDAEYIEDVFARGEVDRIYLNFSDPWPKEKHARRRLTSRQFLARYGNILKEDGQVEFKTDNEELFTFSLEEVPEAGWKILEETRDLHADPSMNEGNIMTEYEERFSANGKKICKMIIRRK